MTTDTIATVTTEQASKLETTADRERQTVNAAFQTVSSQDARGHLAVAHAAAAEVRHLGNAQAASIAAATKEAAELAAQGYSEASRVKLGWADALRVSAEQAIAVETEAAYGAIAIVEATLKASVIPAPKTAADRQLARDEILRAVDGASSFEAVTRLGKLAGKDDAIDAELLDGFSERLIADPAAWEQHKRLAVAKILQLPKHTATAKAIAACNLARGTIAIERSAANLRIKA